MKELGQWNLPQTIPVGMFKFLNTLNDKMYPVQPRARDHKIRYSKGETTVLL